jgi:hypothetical protein
MNAQGTSDRGERGWGAIRALQKITEQAPVGTLGIVRSRSIHTIILIGNALEARRRLVANGLFARAEMPAVPHAANTGLLCDGLRVDVDDPELAGSVRALIAATFGDDVPIRYRVNSGRCAALLRAASGSPGKRVLPERLGKIEVLGYGQQSVSHGIHPSGANLYWYPDPLERVARNALRAVTEDEITTLLNAAAPLIEAELEPKPNGPVIPPHDDTATIDPQKVIPNDRAPDWEHWNAVGMAAASGGTEAGFNAWCRWSAKHPCHQEAACS